jgi:hypothetical protein
MPGVGRPSSVRLRGLILPCYRILKVLYIKRTCLFGLISTDEKQTAVRILVVFMLETLHRPFSRPLLPWLTGASQHPMQSINAAIPILRQDQVKWKEDNRTRNINDMLPPDLACSRPAVTIGVRRSTWWVSNGTSSVSFGDRVRVELSQLASPETTTPVHRYNTT